MNESLRLATKAQATAVRDYLATLGIELSHTQALEVIARGEGMRSRHLLANGTAPAALKQVTQNWGHRTVVEYTYADGSNCKRSSQLVFRGRLKPEQLRFIASRLDEGQFFVPTQIGFESLHFAFTDFGGDEHDWHALSLAPFEDWSLDAEGFVLNAGAVRQLMPSEEGVPTDADTDNLVFRFGRVQSWRPQLLRDAYSSGWTPRELAFDEQAVAGVVQSLLHRSPALRGVDAEDLEPAVQWLLSYGFAYHRAPGEFRKYILPNCYLYVIFDEVLPLDGAFRLNFDATTPSGAFLSESPVLLVPRDDGYQALTQIGERLTAIEKRLRSDPAAWSSEFE